MQISRCEITSRDRDSTDRITDLQLATGKPSTPVAFPARDGAVEEAAPSRNRFAKRMSTKWTDSAGDDETKRDDQNEYNQWRKGEKERSKQLAECRFILACCEERRILFIFPAALAATLLVRCKVFYDGSSVPTAPLLNGIRPEAG
ncbi:hypothetical protein ALC53_01944 [Atta colombica]|uniref:Uncharacterized protein n=1 Tax=Atta colombica TaxID=520822 RepID=A0A195BRH1_9HYME|nr:hypothetical protein ALC53_01944 [Atta colombica]